MARKVKKVEEETEKLVISKEVWMGLAVILALAVIFIASYYIFGSIGTVKYEGLTFTKENAGAFYVYHYYYHFVKDEQQYQYNLYLRTNPAKNNVSVSGGEIYFDYDKMNYISINSTGLTQCSDSSLAIAQLSSFLIDNQLDMKVGVSNMAEAKENNLTYISCGSQTDGPVISIQSAEKSSIEIDGSCYKINVANCEILPAVEKFEVKSIIDAKNRTKTNSLF